MTEPRRPGKYIFVLIIICLTAFIIAVTAAAGSNDFTDVPGGEVHGNDELYAALGGESTATLGDGYVMLRYDVRLKEPLILKNGDYVIIGLGCTVSAEFTDDFMITVGDGEAGATLSIGDIGTRSGDEAVVFDGRGKTVDMGIFFIENGSALEIYSGTLITDVVCGSGGGAIYNEGTFRMYDGKMTNCHANGSGGAIFNKGEATLTGGSLSDCSAEYGGAVYNEGKLKLGGTQIEDCIASKGGAVFNTGSTELISSSVNLCTASDCGGAVYNSNKFEMLGGQIQNSKAEKNGGAIYNTGECTESGTFVSGCSAVNGGGLCNCGTMVMTDGTVEECRASERGGNIYNAENADMTYAGGSLYSGEAVYGGGIFNIGKLDVEGGGISLGKAECGAAILNDGTLNFRKYPYINATGDVMVVADETGSHAVNICSELNAETIARLTPGIKTEDGYSASYSEGVVMLAGENVSEGFGRFTVESTDKALWYISKDGTLRKKAPVYERFWFYPALIVVYVLVIFAMVYTVMYFKKKNGKAEKA